MVNGARALRAITQTVAVLGLSVLPGAVGTAHAVDPTTSDGGERDFCSCGWLMTYPEQVLDGQPGQLANYWRPDTPFDGTGQAPVGVGVEFYLPAGGSGSVSPYANSFDGLQTRLLCALSTAPGVGTTPTVLSSSSTRRDWSTVAVPKTIKTTASAGIISTEDPARFFEQYYSWGYETPPAALNQPVINSSVNRPDKTEYPSGVGLNLTFASGATAWDYSVDELPAGVDSVRFMVNSLAMTPDSVLFQPTDDECNGTLADPNLKTCAVYVSQYITVVRPSVVADDTASTAGVPVTVDVIANDSMSVAAGGTGVSSVGAPSHGTAQLQADGTIRYTPAPGFVGTDAFTYVVLDAKTGQSHEATVTVTVTGVPAATETPGTSAPAVPTTESATPPAATSVGASAVAATPRASGAGTLAATGADVRWSLTIAAALVGSGAALTALARRRA